MPDVKPCAFCGCEVVYVVQGSTFRWMVAECHDCGACGPEVRVQTLGKGTPDEWQAQGERDALEEWNRRTP